MEKHLVDERKQTNTDHQANHNLNEDSKGKQPAPTENDSKEGDKETELPGIGDDNETKSDDVKMSSMDEDDDQETDEDSPSGNPMNQKTGDQKNGDSDGAPVTNRKENEVVNN